MRQNSWPIVSAGVGAGSALLPAAAYVAANHGFGQGDLAAFACWNLLFSGYLFAVFAVLRDRIAVAASFSRWAAWLAIGGISGFIWMWIAAASLGGWILAYSFPVLYIWTGAGVVGGGFMAWRGSVGSLMKRGRPWLVVLVPAVALAVVPLLNFGLMLGSRYVWNRPEPELFTFPEDFVGHAYVVYDSVKGAVDPAEESVRRYDFTESGLVVTGSAPPGGWLNHSYYYRGSDGTLIPITAEWNSTIPDTEENRADPTIGIYFVHWGEHTERGCTVKYMSFYVGTKADILEERGVGSLEEYISEHCMRIRASSDTSAA